VSDDPVALLRDLVRIPSPSGDEVRVRDAVLAWLSARGVPCGAQGRNAVAVVEGAPGSDPRRGLLLCTHYDTVPVGPGWTRRDPVDGALEDGRVFGRGANDAKASVAAMMAAAAAAARARLAGRLVVALVCDEETGGQGLEAIRAGLPAFSASVVGEPTGLDVCPAQRGLLRAVVHETGRSCHASRPWEGVNAVEAAAKDVLAIHGIAMPEEDPVLGKATLVATMVAGGTKPNVIPGECTITLDGRSTPAWDNARMLRALRAAVAGRVEVKSERFRPVVTPRDAEIVRVAEAASPTHRVRGFLGVSDLHHVRDVPGVVMGPGTSEQSHAPDESVAAEQVTAAAAAYREVVRGYLGG
jgi:acetylornithine deacetylase/succinyl-diaminopimelate desuccinylase-like protein